jgi:hypothetical protein
MHIQGGDGKSGLSGFDLFRQAAPELLSHKSGPVTVVRSAIAGICVLIALWMTRDWMTGSAVLQLVTSVPRTNQLRCVFGLKVNAVSLPSTSKSPAIEIRGKERKVCNLFRVHARDLFGAEDLGAQGRVDCVLYGAATVRTTAYDKSDEVHVAPTFFRTAVTTPGIADKVKDGQLQVDAWTLVLFFDDGEASRALLPTWSQGIERVSEKMKFHEKGGSQSTVKFAQINCDGGMAEDAPVSRDAPERQWSADQAACASGPALLPAVVMHGPKGERAYAILPDDIEEVITYITQSMLNMNRKPGLELQWPYTLDGSFKLPNVAGQVSLVHNPKAASLNLKAMAFKHEVQHLFFETATVGSGPPASQTLRALSKEKRALVNPLASDTSEIELKKYRHWYTKLVPSVANDDFAKPTYEQSLAVFAQEAKPKLPRAVFRMNYDISRVGFTTSSVGKVTKNTWYDLICRLAGLTTGGYFMTQVFTSLTLLLFPG